MSKKQANKHLLHFFESLFIGVGAFISLSFIGLLAQEASTMMIIAPFGATAVILFSAPRSHFAKPLNIFAGYLISTLIGIFILKYSNGDWLVMGSGIGLTIMLMQFFNVVHPPAGANFFVMAQGHIPAYLFEPLLIGLITLIILSIAIDKMKSKLHN